MQFVAVAALTIEHFWRLLFLSLRFGQGAGVEPIDIRGTHTPEVLDHATPLSLRHSVAPSLCS